MVRRRINGATVQRILIVAGMIVLILTQVSEGRCENRQPTLIGGDPIVVIEPTTNSGSTTIELRNDTKDKIALSLGIGNFVNKATNMVIGARAVIGLANETPPKTEPTAIEPGAVLRLKIELSNVWEAGESTASFENQGVVLAYIKALKHRVPFSVKVEVGTTEQPELVLQKGEVSRLTIKNDDPMTYPVGWTLSLAGKAESATGPDFLLGPTTGEPNDFTPPPQWFSDWWSSLFKDQVVDGSVTVRLKLKTTVANPVVQAKVVPVKVRLRTLSSSVQELLFYVFILFFLVAGAACSLLTSYMLPNQLRRADLTERLIALRQRIRSLSKQIPSPLRIQIRMQRQRIHDMLTSRKIFSPDLAVVFTQCELLLGTLQKEMDVLTQMDQAFLRLMALRSDTSQTPVSLLRESEKILERACDALLATGPIDKQVEEAGHLVYEASKGLENPNQENKEFALALAERVTELANQFDENGDIGRLAECGEIRPHIQDLLNVIANPVYRDQSKLKPSHYYLLDLTIEKLFVMRHYLLRWHEAKDSLTDDSKMALKKIEGQKVELLRLLQFKTWDALDKARMIRRQVDSGIFEDDIKDEIDAGAVDILWEPSKPAPGESTRLRAVFNRSEFNRASARQRFTCVWNFGEVGIERGWEITHYFMPNDHNVTVAFEDANGVHLAPSKNNLTWNGGQRTIQLQPRRDEYFSGHRTGVELARMGVVLVVTMLGFVAGAREQVLKLDLIPGFIAVFLVGFGADKIKELLAQRQA